MGEKGRGGIYNVSACLLACIRCQTPTIKLSHHHPRPLSSWFCPIHAHAQFASAAAVAPNQLISPPPKHPHISLQISIQHPAIPHNHTFLGPPRRRPSPERERKQPGPEVKNEQLQAEDDCEVYHWLFAVRCPVLGGEGRIGGSG